MIIRYLRDMHWAALAVTTRIFSVLELTLVCAVMGLYCFPNCDFDRWAGDDHVNKIKDWISLLKSYKFSTFIHSLFGPTLHKDNIIYIKDDINYFSGGE